MNVLEAVVLRERTYHKIQTVFKRDDEGRLQVNEWTDPAFHFLKNNLWNATEKIDGTNVRVQIIPDGHITFAGRTSRAQLPARLVEHLEATFHNAWMVQKLQEQFPHGGILFGEGFGAGIQKGGGNYRPDQVFTLFDVAVGSWWLKRADVVRIAHSLSILHVPVLEQRPLVKLIELVRGGFSSAFGNFPAEGLIAEPAVPLQVRSGKRIITKLKTSDFVRAMG